MVRPLWRPVAGLASAVVGFSYCYSSVRLSDAHFTLRTAHPLLRSKQRVPKQSPLTGTRLFENSLSNMWVSWLRTMRQPLNLPTKIVECYTPSLVACSGPTYSRGKLFLFCLDVIDSSVASIIIRLRLS